MVDKGRRRTLILGALSWLPIGCDTVRDQTAVIDYAPTASPVRLSGADHVTLSVVAVDKRSGAKDRLSVKKGIVGAIVYAGNDPVELVRSAIERDLKAEGFMVGVGGFMLTVEVENFYGDFRANAALFMNVAADVTFTIRLRDATGVTRYRHTYEGVAQLGPVYNESAEKVKITLEQALASAVGQVADDKALQAALLGRLSATRPGQGV